MNWREFKRVALISMLLSLSGSPRAEIQAPPVLKLPPGFKIEIWVDGVANARAMALGEHGTLFVGSRGAGKVYALRDTNADGRPDKITVLAEGLNMPSGIAFRDGDLYVAEVQRIWKLPAIEQHLDAPPRPVAVRSDLPDKTHHGWRFIAFGPDGKLYVAIGAPCNVCELESFSRDGKNLQFGSITRMDADGRNWEIVARGVRNSVGFDWDPATQKLWFTENGRDMLGDDMPSCELNVLAKPGEDFGFPYCHAGTIADPEYGRPGGCSSAKPPAALLGPHVAPLGMAFYTGSQFPAEYRGNVFVAEHGSWNRTKKNGYRVQRLRVVDGKVVGQQPFVEGWLQDEKVSGRPADVLQMPDGSLLISDDEAGRIWRVSYVG
ncbi:MAG: sorbosone dehydrogenase family protein [Hydrocarboniphaga sp.]|uniref:PQQ-dependent sugar dehydrogenase n=1 Tax=Hydrocarboniphaga sp. TaxID=2033016 RepID=UPI002626FCBF|nr:sorbosone dehydrogenase family protein [Hydrocarboniphaga sp.]MDB5971853.1 sorbosone dehydrogenase family protein [Hydrocarboniphaga sp.]